MVWGEFIIPCTVHLRLMCVLGYILVTAAITVLLLNQLCQTVLEAETDCGVH